MNDLVEGCRIEGLITLDDIDIYKDMDVNILRKRVGMVTLKFYNDMTYDQMAKALMIPSSTVKHRTKSALKELKTLLEGEEKNER